MKRIVLFLVVACPMVLMLLSCGQRSARVRNVIVYENGGGGEELVLENEYLEFRFLPASAGFTLQDKKSGAFWHSNPPGLEEDPLADPVTLQLMRSQFSLDYADNAGVGQTLYSAEQSVDRGAFEYSLVEGGLEVRYTVGDLARPYIFPAAAPEERMLAFLEKIDRSDRRKIEASYRLYDIGNLRSGDDKNSLLSRYPDLAQGKVYVLRDNTQEYMKAQIEEFFAAAGYTYDDYLADTARFVSADGPEKPAFSIILRYELSGNSLVLRVPFDRIAFRPAYPLTRLSLLPFMGAGGVGDEGYLLVPDGSGALIRFNNGKQNQIAYDIAMYGWDEGMPRDAVISDNKAAYPAFGVQKNGAALLCVIEEGAPYAHVRADVSGRNCSWNSAHAWFNMIHGTKMDISGRSDRAVYLYEAGLPEDENIVLRFTPCAADGYVGMAKEYRAWLLEKYPGLGNKTIEDIPIAVEIVGAVNKTQHRLGLPFDLPLKLTSYQEAASMIRDFAEFGWKGTKVKLIGWFNGGVDHSVPSRIKLIGALGGKKGFKNLALTAEQRGSALFLEAGFLYMRDSSLLNGFNLYRDAARYVNRKRIESYPYSFVWFGERFQWGKLYYIARPVYMAGLIDGFVKQFPARGGGGIAFRALGAKLAGDYNEKRLVSRAASMRRQEEKLAALAQSGTGVLLNTGFAYAAPYAGFITDLALGDQGFGITDVAVPFYQIVLHGLVPYSGPAINLAEDYTKNILEIIEGGAGLYFSFMKEETAVLQETKFRQFYANEYGKWIDDADALYKRFAADFSGLFGQAIENHEILAPGVTVTEYEDGTRVLVNMGEKPWERDGVRVRQNGYTVIR